MHIQKQSLQVTLDADLVRRAKRLSRDLDGTIETLLASYIEAEEAKKASEKQQIEQWITNSNEFVEKHGSPADEYSPF